MAARKDIGKLRHRVTLQTLTEIPGPGQATKSYGDVGTYWACVEPFRGNEVFTSGQNRALLYHKITLRRVGTIRPNDRLLFETTGRIFNVESIYRIDEQNNMLELACVEQVK